ncbi:hypothetical protein GCM10027062_29900 [Nocardioides hungaricus]
MLPTVEQTQTPGMSFPRGRVASSCARAVPSAALVLGPRTVADLVVELHAVTRPMTYLSPSSRREVVAAGMARHGP